MIPTLSQDALRARTASDYTVASDHADQLCDTSRIARQQAGELERLRNRVLYAVEDAHNAGFAVGEDLSVTDTRTSRITAELAARQAQAQVFAADIRSRAGALLEREVERGCSASSSAALSQSSRTIVGTSRDGADVAVGVVRNLD